MRTLLLFAAATLVGAQAHAKPPRHKRPAPKPRPAVTISIPGVAISLGGPWRPGYAPAARAGYVWVDGYWLRGRWMPGHWKPVGPARAGHVWVVGHWNGDVYVDGYWRPTVRVGYVWVDGYYAHDGYWVDGHWAHQGGHTAPAETEVYDHTYDQGQLEVEGSYDADPGGYDATYDAPAPAHDHEDHAHGAHDDGYYEAYSQEPPAEAPLAIPMDPTQGAPADEAPPEDEAPAGGGVHHGIDF